MRYELARPTRHNSESLPPLPRAREGRGGGASANAGGEAFPRPARPPPQAGEVISQPFFREKNALNAAIASVERIRSPNRWLS